MRLSTHSQRSSSFRLLSCGKCDFTAQNSCSTQNRNFATQRLHFTRNVQGRNCAMQERSFATQNPVFATQNPEFPWHAQRQDFASKNGTFATLLQSRKLATQKRLANGGPQLSDFMPKSALAPEQDWDEPPYLEENLDHKRKFMFEVYGCQMNVSDVEIARSILLEKGFTETRDPLETDVMLIMTCAIREKAEGKIWQRIRYYKNLRKRRSRPLTLGILGCMAERLRGRLVEPGGVDIVAGPDAYRDLPRLLAVGNREAAVNVMLSADETYADVAPVREFPESKTAYVTIMRGCDNFCTFCIVPFTRGTERSRPIESIVAEVKRLSEQGVREVTLLGQNVNSYRDLSQSDHYPLPLGEASRYAEGFKSVYRPKTGGRRFVDVLDAVSSVDPANMRVRFTAPHPKDFPLEVLQLINARPNICRQLLLPAQSGSNRILELMNRGYTREAYLDLVEQVKETVPGVSLSSDFIAGFCTETESDHLQTIDLIERVGYSTAFCFAYSMREKTKAHRRLTDDVPREVKTRRTSELMSAYRKGALRWNRAMLGTQQLILITGADLIRHMSSDHIQPSPPLCTNYISALSIVQLGT